MRNWTVKEAVLAIKAGTDVEGIQEIAKHFPMFFKSVCENDMAGFAMLTTDKFTLGRLAKTPTATENTDGEDEGTEDTAAEAGDTDLDSMSTKQLMGLCDKRGIKVPHYGKNKQFYLDALAGGASESEAKAEVEAEEDATEDEDPYVGKNAMQLFKMCKERGIKAQPKKKAAEYIKLLKAADAESEKEEDAEDESWDDAEEEAPAKTTNTSKVTKGKTKPSAKPAKKAETEDDGDDDWEI